MAKGIGYFISGAVTGAVATYVIMKSKQETVRKEAQKEIDLIKKDYTWKKVTDDVDSDDDESSKEDEEEEDHRQVYNYAARSEKMRKAHRERDEERKIFRSVMNQDYLNDLIDEGEEDEEDDDDDIYSDSDPYPDGRPDSGADDVLHPSEGSHDRPFSISADLFANTCNHFDKCTLIWYSVDDVLTDESNERIVDFGIVGHDWRKHVGEYEKDVAYIRNEAISVDYEIIKENLSFFRDAL